MIERFYFANLMPLLIRDTTELCNSPFAGSQGKSPEALKQCMAARGEWILPPTLNTTKQHKEAIVLPTCIQQINMREWCWSGNKELCQCLGYNLHSQWGFTDYLQ